MFVFRRATVFCLEYRLSKHKMTRYSKNFGGLARWPALATPFFSSVQYISASRQSQNTLSGIQGQEATAVADIYVTAPTISRKTTKYK